jgi:hypothetical protein
LNGLSLNATESIDKFIFTLGDASIAIADFKAVGADTLNINALGSLTGSGVNIISATTSSNITVNTHSAYIVTDDANNGFNNVTTVIGNAIDESSSGSEKAVFIIDDGSNSRIYLYQNDSVANTVQNGELTQIAVLIGTNTTNLNISDIIFS